MIGNKKASNINGDFICEKFRRRKIYHNIYIQTVLQNCKAVCIFMIIAVEIKNFKTGKVMVLGAVKNYAQIYMQTPAE